MGATRALVTVKAGTVYINDKEIAQEFLANVASQSQQHGTVDQMFVQPFLERMQSVAAEVGSQVALSAATGTPCPKGSDAYQLARKVAPRLANDVRTATRRSGLAKHNFKEEANSSDAFNHEHLLEKEVISKRDVDESPINLNSFVGTWEYAPRRSYTITRAADKLYYHDGAKHGTLEVSGEWVQGQLTENAEAVGMIKLCRAKDADNSSLIMSRFREGESEWGRWQVGCPVRAQHVSVDQPPSKGNTAISP